MKRIPKQSWRNYGLIALALLVVATFFSHRIAVLYTDWLWHRELGSQVVFLRVYGTRVFLFCVFGATSFLLAYINVWLADRISPPSSVPTGSKLALYPITSGKPIGRTMRALSGLRYVLDALLLIGAFIFAVIAGLLAQGQWDDFLRFTHPEPFHIVDPQFRLDIGFYIFTLPFLRFVQGWSLTITLLIGAGVAVVYLYQQGINRASGNMVVLPHVRGHLSVIVGIVFLILAWGIALERYSILLGDNGGVVGAFFTEIHARLPYLTFLIVVSLIAAVASFVNLWLRTLFLPIVSVLVWLACNGIGFAWTAVYYRIQVIPNESALESRYFVRSLEATRAAYGLDKLKTVYWNALPKPAVVPEDAELLQNFPLWEEEPLREILYTQQGYRRFTALSDPRTDRYQINGKQQLVQIVTREVNNNNIDPRAYTWPNLHLRYTHGVGMVALRGNTSEGSPNYLLSGMPSLTSYPELTLTEPHLYFGNTSFGSDYVVVNAELPEFTFGGEGGDQEIRYNGTAGIPLTSLSRLAFAVRYGAFSLALSREVTPRSRILFSRYVSLRVKRVAPFLLLDGTSCPVIINGRTVWIQNAYTTADSYPYSAYSLGQDKLSYAVQYNYIRPSVTATVDAYNGTVTLYVADENDPVIRSYQRIFPKLFRKMSEMPAALRAHRRYPRDLFSAQRRILTEYNASNAVAFYGRTDVWRLPQRETPALNGNPATPFDLPPYFAQTRMSENDPPEFVMLSAFTPQGKTNLSAILLARSDEPHFGELYLYRFDNAVRPPGPEQIDRRIRTEARTAAYLGQVAEVGEPSFGEVRLLPVAGKRIYYIQSLYVRPTKSSSETILNTIPRQLKRVAVSTPQGNGFAPTVLEAFNGLLPLALPLAEGSSLSLNASSLIARAEQLFHQGQNALRQGDFAGYGIANQELGTVLKELHKLARPATPAKAITETKSKRKQ